MPIVWIEESSPLTITVESDDGEVLNRMEVEGVRGKDAVWRVTDVKDPAPSNPIFQKGFRMRCRDEGNMCAKRYSRRDRRRSRAVGSQEPGRRPVVSSARTRRRSLARRRGSG
jgi:hypothetical protein